MRQRIRTEEALWDELVDLQMDTDMVACTLSVTDAAGRPWTVWEAERGDLWAASYVAEHEAGWPIPATELAYPLSVGR